MSAKLAREVARILKPNAPKGTKAEMGRALARFAKETWEPKDLCYMSDIIREFCSYRVQFSGLKAEVIAPDGQPVKGTLFKFISWFLNGPSDPKKLICYNSSLLQELRDIIAHDLTQLGVLTKRQPELTEYCVLCFVQQSAPVLGLHEGNLLLNSGWVYGVRNRTLYFYDTDLILLSPAMQYVFTKLLERHAFGKDFWG